MNDRLTHDLEQRPNVVNGFLVTANNRVSEDRPYISLDFAGPSRHNRIVELLDALPEATVADMPTIHRDVRSLAAAPVCAIIAGLQPSTDLGRTACDLVAAWDHEVTADSAAAVVYAAFRQAWAVEVEDRLDIGRLGFGEASADTPFAVRLGVMLRVLRESGLRATA